MIASLTGILLEKGPTEVQIDVQGVGYAVSIPLSTYEKLGDVGTRVTLHTHLHVREDAMQLYGFASTAQREMFRLLISVTGIGPRMAQGILSGTSDSDLRAYLAGGDLEALIALPGIGRKLAERLIIELREKVTKTRTPTRGTEGPAGSSTQIQDEAIMALISLGFKRSAAEKAVRNALSTMDGRHQSVENLIKAALRSAGS